MQGRHTAFVECVITRGRLGSLGKVWQGDGLDRAWMRDKVSAQKGALSGAGLAASSCCSCAIGMKWRFDIVKPVRVVNCKPVCTQLLEATSAQQQQPYIRWLVSFHACNV